MDKLMSADNLSAALTESVGNNPNSVLDLEEELIDEHVEPKEEITEQDIQNTWSGLLDTTVPPTSIPPEAKPVTSMVCDAITELSTSLSFVEDEFVKKMSEAAEKRPSLESTVTDIRNDVAEFIQ